MDMDKEEIRATVEEKINEFTSYFEKRFANIEADLTELITELRQIEFKKNEEIPAPRAKQIKE